MQVEILEANELSYHASVNCFAKLRKLIAILEKRYQCNNISCDFDVRPDTDGIIGGLFLSKMPFSK
jgi:hypothetical protein